MTRRPDLGLMLAGAGLVVIVAAVIVGFVAVGGPGQARSIRLDIMKLDRMRDIGRAAACAVGETGDVPANLADLAARPSDTPPTRSPNDWCQYYDASAVRDPGGVTYERLDNSHVRLCADFLLSYDQVRKDGRRFGREEGFRELSADRPAGHHCYDVKVGK